MLYVKIGVTIVYNFALRKFDFRGWWSPTPKNRGQSKKTQGRTALKNWGGSLAVCSYLQRGSAPPPPPTGILRWFVVIIGYDQLPSIYSLVPTTYPLSPEMTSAAPNTLQNQGQASMMGKSCSHLLLLLTVNDPLFPSQVLLHLFTRTDPRSN